MFILQKHKILCTFLIYRINFDLTVLPIFLVTTLKNCKYEVWKFQDFSVQWWVGKFLVPISRPGRDGKHSLVPSCLDILKIAKVSSCLESRFPENLKDLSCLEMQFCVLICLELISCLVSQSRIVSSRQNSVPTHQLNKKYQKAKFLAPKPLKNAKIGQNWPNYCYLCPTISP